MSSDILGFELEWFDPVCKQVRQLFLKFFIADNTIEILNGDTASSSKQAAFLKRIYYPDVKIQDLSLGNTITV